MIRYSVALAALVLLAGCEQGSYFNDDTVPTRADAVSRMETAGMDLRIYEFTPRHRPDQDCIFVAGDSKAGLWCLPKLSGRTEPPGNP